MTEHWPELATILPHRGPSLLVREVRAAGGERLTAMASIPQANGLVDVGAAHPMLAVEIAAQAAALFQTVRQTGPAQPGGVRGFLVGIRQVALASTSLPVDTELRIDVEPRSYLPPLFHYWFELRHDDHLLASGTISIYVTAAP
jgi:predicted hotdog family 3-hydroxylacyl-ACP dehydratase